MTLPARKRFPIAFEVSLSPGGSAAPACPRDLETPGDAIGRVAARCGWGVMHDGARWVVEPGGDHRVLVETAPDETRDRALRLSRPLPDVELGAAHEAELLRRNARTAHAGFAIGRDGRAALTASLTGQVAGESEIEAAIRSIAAGGEAVGTKQLTAFDPTVYATPADQGDWEALILRESLGRAAIAFQFAGARAVASLALDGGKHKSVHILFDRADAWGDQLVQVISIAAPAPPDWHRKALVANASLVPGHFALATFGPLESLVVVRTLLARTCVPETLHDTVGALARVAEKAEFHLLGAEGRPGA